VVTRAFLKSKLEPAVRRRLRIGMAAAAACLCGAHAMPSLAQTLAGLDATPSLAVAGLDVAPGVETPVIDMGVAKPDAPMRVTLTQELSAKVTSPERIVKNRSSAELEYSKYFNNDFFVQFDGKAIDFLPEDHRHDAEGTDVEVSRAYVQTSFGQTSLKAGIQVLPWGESLVAPITDEVSPRDNRELFNFNLEELRVGQPMVVAENYSNAGRWSVFWIPEPAFNKNPVKGTEYYFDPFTYAPGNQGPYGPEYGASWRKNFGGADVTLMGASLLDNDYALRMNANGTVSQVRDRFSMAGAVFTYAFKDFVLRGEAAYKSPKAYDDSALQIVKRNAFDVSAGFDYRWSSSLTLSAEAVDQHIVRWSGDIQTFPADRQTILLSLTKLLMNDDLSINVLDFYTAPYHSNLAMLVTSLKWDDHLTFGLNLVYPHTSDPRSGLWPVRDEKQIAFKVEYQF
jgi:hypothetical protein